MGKGAHMRAVPTTIHGGREPLHERNDGLAQVAIFDLSECLHKAQVVSRNNECWARVDYK
jgi:hypothetical protein